MLVADAVAEPTRRRLLDVLREGECSVTELAGRLHLSQPATSKHLRVLRDSGLVRVRVDGQRRYYRLDPMPLQALDQWLAPYRQFWTDQLDTLESHLAAHPRSPPTDGRFRPSTPGQPPDT
jgi:DNA-binding transcriptional ArsR family regulator